MDSPGEKRDDDKIDSCMKVIWKDVKCVTINAIEGLTSVLKRFLCNHWSGYNGLCGKEMQRKEEILRSY